MTAIPDSPHPEERALARVSKDGRTLPWFETRGCAALLTMRANPDCDTGFPSS
jgi:hypothetical protein